ncbi:MAG: tRNA (N6-isopentenyl adenosine(37)-C2)-methylthiotransferase MiaB, partial [Desulfovibrionaceae bacterium]|nr:tRNA (N6-isopentenyl adenosine(37)-C2)-methylthiotransferase MiaB [Desulfovibrionaceae bacterium]
SSLLAPHLHISLQHASSAVLRRMGRGHYSAATLTEALGRLHAAWPVMGLGADILVGFPGETAADVDTLCRFVEETPFSYAHVFPYSRRPGTPAADFPAQLPRAEKQARAAAVRAVVAQKAGAFRMAQAKEPWLDIVLDTAEGNAVPGRVHGVSACYTPCYLKAGELALLDARAGHRDYIRVRPTGVCERGVLVELAGQAERTGQD